MTSAVCRHKKQVEANANISSSRADWARVFNVAEVAKQRGTSSLRQTGLTVFVALNYWITGTENSSDPEIPLTLFSFNETFTSYLQIRITCSKIWLLVSVFYLFRFVFKLENGTELPKKICVLPDTNLHSQWHDSSLVVGESFYQYHHHHHHFHHRHHYHYHHHQHRFHDHYHHHHHHHQTLLFICVSLSLPRGNTPLLIGIYENLDQNLRILMI